MELGLVDDLATAREVLARRFPGAEPTTVVGVGVLVRPPPRRRAGPDRHG